MGLGYNKKPVQASITTPTRSFGVNYQNTSGRPMLIIATITCDKGAAGDDAYGIGKVEDVSPPTALYSRSGLMSRVSSQVQKGIFTIVIVIPNEWYYRFDKIEGGSSSVTLNVTVEVIL